MAKRRYLAGSSSNSPSPAVAMACPTRSSIVVLTASGWRGMDFTPSISRDGYRPTMTAMRLVRPGTRLTP